MGVGDDDGSEGRKVVFSSCFSIYFYISISIWFPAQVRVARFDVRFSLLGTWGGVFLCAWALVTTWTVWKI